MKKVILIVTIISMSLTSCVSKKKYTELELKSIEIQDLLNTATVKLNTCLTEREALASQVDFLKKNNTDLINNMGNLTTLTTKGAENLEKSLESLKEKDLKITRLQDALTKKDSVTLALVTSLKREVGIDDPDININVEKGVVMISIADNLLFKSGSYDVNTKAKNVLAKVAKVINSKPDFECMVEGHTDNVPFKSDVLLDNWDLSVMRSTSVVKLMLENSTLDPTMLTAAGRGEFMPLDPAKTAEAKAKNRRIEIILTPNLDQLFEILDKAGEDYKHKFQQLTEKVR